MDWAATIHSFDHVYWWGVLGSLAVEIAAATKGASELKGYCPPQYKRPLFLLFKAAFAIICAGPLSIILGATGAFNAFYIGASAPLIMDRVAKGLEPKAASDEGA